MSPLRCFAPLCFFAPLRFLAPLALLLAALAAPAAEVQLEIPDPLIPNVQITGELRVIDEQSAPVNVTFPSIPGMTIDVGEGARLEQRIENGKVSTVRGIPLVFTARIRGPTPIPPITLHLKDNTTLQTAATVVQVADGNPNLTGEAYAEAVFQPATIVPGEAARLIYRIHLRRGQAETIGIEPPAGSILLGERTIVQGRSYDQGGNAWTLYTITWPLTMATPGTHEVGGQQDYQVVVGSGFFDNRVLKGRVAVAPTILTVKPLPSEGRPDDFTGLIGPLALNAELDRPRISAGEGVELRIIATGRQVDLLKAPMPALPAGVQAYPKPDGKPQEGKADGKGEVKADKARIFRLDLVPSTAGDLVVPAISIPYFDPEAKAYRRAESRPLTLTVIPGRTRDLGLPATVTPPPVTAPPTTPAVAPSGALPPGPSLPPPLRGDAPQPPSPQLPLLVGLAFLAAGGLLAGIRLLWSRRPAAHRGKALAASLANGDLDGAAFALASLRPALTTDQQRASAGALEQAIDRARFGGQALSDPATWLRDLEKLP